MVKSGRPRHKPRAVDPAVSVLTMNESLVQMKVPHSKRWYLCPPEKEILVKQCVNRHDLHPMTLDLDRSLGSSLKACRVSSR